MKYMAFVICQQLIDKQIIPKKSCEIYMYGLEMLLSSSFTSLSVIVIACIMDTFYFGMLYLLITIPLRITAGGYHANTYSKCFLLSNLSYAVISFLQKFLEPYNISTFIWLSILYMSAIYISVQAPVPNVKQPLSPKLYKRNKHRAQLFTFLICIGITVCLFIFSINKMLRVSILSVVMVALYIIPTQKKGDQRRENNIANNF